MLVYVLWIVVLLSIFVIGIARSIGLSNRTFLNQSERVALLWAAKGGVERAIGVLSDDLTSYDSTTDGWGSLSPDLNDVTIGNSSVTVEVVDEASKLNINTATKKQLLALPNMDEAIVAAIIDWRDKNSTPESGGVEGSYYEQLSPPYAIRNDFFGTLRELLLVKGVDADVFYGEDRNLNGSLDFNENDGENFPPVDNADGLLEEGIGAWLTCYSYEENKDPEGNERFNLKDANENKLVNQLGIARKYAKWIAEKHKNPKSIADLISRNSPKTPDEAGRGNSTAIDLETYAGIVDKLTLSDDKLVLGLVNINTASRDVLLAITEGDDDLVESILAYRNENLLPITSIGALLSSDSIGVAGFKKIADKITVRSKVFTAMSRAQSESTGAQYSIEAVLDRNDSGASILYWYQGAES